MLVGALLVLMGLALLLVAVLGAMGNAVSTNPSGLVYFGTIMITVGLVVLGWHAVIQLFAHGGVSWLGR
jgi:hypothetical protein